MVMPSRFIKTVAFYVCFMATIQYAGVGQALAKTCKSSYVTAWGNQFVDPALAKASAIQKWRNKVKSSYGKKWNKWRRAKKRRLKTTIVFPVPPILKVRARARPCKK